MAKMMTDIVPRLKEVNDVIDTYSDGIMPFEQAYAIDRFYFDFQDTNVIIDEAVRMAIAQEDELFRAKFETTTRTIDDVVT